MGSKIKGVIRTKWGSVTHSIVLSVAIFLVAMLGLEWESPHRIYSPVMPVAGLALAVLFLRGITQWPWVALGLMLARWLARPELPTSINLTLTVVHTSAYAIGAFYLRYRGLNRALSTLVDVKTLITAAVIVSIASGLAVVLAEYLTVQHEQLALEPLEDFVGILFSRFTGVLIVGSLILTFSPSRVKAQCSRESWRIWLCLSGVITLTSIVFSSLNIERPVTWMLFPPLILTALTGNTFLTAQSLLIVGIEAVWGTANELGPFANEKDSIVILHQFLSVFSISGLVLTAVAQERREKVAAQQRGEDLQFLSDTAADLLPSATLLASVQRMAPRLAARCNVEIVTYHTTPNGTDGPLQPLIQHGLPSKPLGACVLAELESTIGRILRDTFPEVTLWGEERNDAPTHEARSIRSCVCQPIVDQGKLLGVLSIASTKRTRIDSGEVKLLETVAYDITTAARRLRQEGQLRESESRFRELSNAVPDIVWGTKADGTPEFYNQRWYEFTGETEASESRIPFVSLCEPTQRDDVARRWNTCLRSGERFEMEHQLKHLSGAYRWVLTRALPTRAPNGAIVRWVGTSSDVHDKRVVEAERDSLLESERSARMEAERANRLKDDFLATLSHELRNPINIIVGWAHLLSRAKVEPAKAAQIIEHSAHMQAQLIDDLLDLSRIVSGKLTLSRTVVRLSDVVLSTIDSMQLVAHEKGVELTARVEPDVQLAHADTARMTQIVSNLITNAIKFTPRGGQVVVTLASAHEEAVLAVSDTGEGISAEFLPHIFDRFRQADASTTRRHGGLGIGLAIVKHMTSLHGGSISAISPGLGHGATFTVRLPLRFTAAGISPSPHEPGTLTPRAAAEALHGARVVLVEDDLSTLEFLERFLSEKGATVVPCSNGEMALENVRAGRPDIVISDIGMPDMDGYQLVKHLRTLPTEGTHLPIIAVTAFARPEDETRALQAGFDAHVAKPVDLEKLEHTVLSLLGGPDKAAA